MAQVLCVHYAADHITMATLEERLALVYRSQSWEDLDRLVSDLPAVSEKLDVGAAPIMAPSRAIPPRSFVMAFMGGVARKGSWLVPRELKIVAVMGGAEIDLREARFGPGVTDIDVTVFMGGVEIIVPRGVRVELVGGAFMGGFESDAGDATALDPNQPVLRVTGLAVMGGVEVKVKRPGKKTLARFEQAMRALGRPER